MKRVRAGNRTLPRALGGRRTKAIVERLKRQACEFRHTVIVANGATFPCFVRSRALRTLPALRRIRDPARMNVYVQGAADRNLAAGNNGAVRKNRLHIVQLVVSRVARHVDDRILARVQDVISQDVVFPTARLRWCNVQLLDRSIRIVVDAKPISCRPRPMRTSVRSRREEPKRRK